MEEIGPVEYMIVSFPGNRFTGEIAPALGKLVESNMIRIIDLAFVSKDADGSIGAFELSDVEGTMLHARRALDLVGEDEHLSRGGATALLGLAHWTRGDLEEALRLYAEGMARVAKAGYVADLVGSAITVVAWLIASAAYGVWVTQVSSVGSAFGSDAMNALLLKGLS